MPYVREIVLFAQKDRKILLRGESGKDINFSGLERLLDVSAETSSPNPANVLLLNSNPNGEVFLRSTGLCFGFDPEMESFSVSADLSATKKINPVRFWHAGVVFGVASGMLRGMRCLPLHGSWLQTAHGALLLCGNSGVGKSTTARRWRTAGGEAPADDMILLDFGPDGIFVHPLPTWSLCLESTDGLCYPVRRRMKLAGVLGLGRSSGPEEIRPVSNRDFFAQICASCFYHLSGIARSLPDKQRETLIARMRDGADALASAFSPRALFAALNGDLRKTLEIFE